jgi:hypothetical protein
LLDVDARETLVAVIAAAGNRRPAPDIAHSRTDPVGRERNWPGTAR